MAIVRVSNSELNRQSIFIVTHSRLPSIHTITCLQEVLFRRFVLSINSVIAVQVFLPDIGAWGGIAGRLID